MRANSDPPQLASICRFEWLSFSRSAYGGSQIKRDDKNVRTSEQSLKPIELATGNYDLLVPEKINGTFE
jgi:hypothetical protein